MLLRLLSPAALFLAVLAAPAPAQNLVDQDPLIVWGTVERLYSHERLLLRSSDDRLFEVHAPQTKIELTGGDLGRWDDLRVGQDVDVFGTARDDQSIDASRIRITGRLDTQRAPNGRYGQQPNRSADNRYYLDQQYHNAPMVDVTGTVSSVDADRQSVRLRTRQGLRTVELYDGTRVLFESGRSAGTSDMYVGDSLRVRGEGRDGRIVAEQVTLLGPSRSSYSDQSGESGPYERGGTVIVGTVRGSTYLLSRRIKVRASQGDISVDVAKNTPITKYDDRVSVHELESGDRVRIVGDWVGGNRFRASRIDVVPPPRPIRQQTRSYRAALSTSPMSVVTALGTLVSYDEKRNRMRLSTQDGDRIVVANGTPAFVRGQKISRLDFRQGDRVRATGYWDGQEILATRVELAY